MNLCLYAQATDLIQTRKTSIEKLNNLVIKDEKHAMFKNESLDHIFQSLRESGVDGLELNFPVDILNENVEAIKKLIQKNKMSVFGIHQSNDSSFSISLNDIKDLCEIADRFSAKVVVLHIDSLKEQIFDNDFINVLKTLQKKYNVLFGIENMPKSPLTLKKSYTYEGNEFASVINEAGLFMTLDTTHLGQVRGDICDFYLKNKERIVHIHLSDYKTSWLNRKLLLANDTHLPLGKGELPIIKFLKILKKENYQGTITMEINSDIDGLCESAKLIKENIS